MERFVPSRPDCGERALCPYLTSIYPEMISRLLFHHCSNYITAPSSLQLDSVSTHPLILHYQLPVTPRCSYHTCLRNGARLSRHPTSLTYCTSCPCEDPASERQYINSVRPPLLPPLHTSTTLLNLFTQNITEPLFATPDTRSFRLHNVFWQQLSTTRIARPHRSPARLYHGTDVPRPLRSIRQLLWTANQPTGHAGSYRYSSCERPATAPFSHNHWPIGITRPNIALPHQPPHTNRESI
jgi:hypothetical protein